MLVDETRYIYDGGVSLQERDRDNLPRRSYIRGSDLSGTGDGMGGIDGLLANVDVRSGEPALLFYLSEPNGNIACVFDSSGEISGAYRYEPLGRVSAVGQETGLANRMRMMGKETEEANGLVYFGRRYYHSQLGRWLTKDPSGFWDGPNQYAFAGNDLNGAVDAYGEAGVMVRYIYYGPPDPFWGGAGAPERLRTFSPPSREHKPYKDPPPGEEGLGDCIIKFDPVNSYTLFRWDVVIPRAGVYNTSVYDNDPTAPIGSPIEITSQASHQIRKHELEHFEVFRAYVEAVFSAYERALRAIPNLKKVGYQECERHFMTQRAAADRTYARNREIWEGPDGQLARRQQAVDRGNVAQWRPLASGWSLLSTQKKPLGYLKQVMRNGWYTVPGSSDQYQVLYPDLVN